MTLTPLEWLGLEMALQKALAGKTAQHRLAILLLKARGRPVNYEFLDEAVTKNAERSARRQYYYRTHKAAERLRGLLDDWGLSRIVETVPGVGYRISAEGAASLLAALDEYFDGELFSSGVRL